MSREQLVDGPEPARSSAEEEGSQAPLATRPRLGQLLTLAWPVIIARSAQVVVGLTDAVMVGKLGTAALAATTAGATNTFNILVLPMGTVFIVSSFASQLTGAGDHIGARRFAWYGLGIALAAGLLSLGAIPLLDDVIGQLSYAPDVQVLMSDYLRFRLLSGGFAIGLEALGAYYNGVGNTRLPMIVQLVAMVLNIFLNWVLIYGHLGAPALGVTGAAIASSIASFLAFSLLLVLFLRGVGAKKEGGTRAPLSAKEMGRTLRYGLPVGFNWFIEFAAFSFVMNVVFAGLGTTALAAMMAVLQVNSVSFMPAFGLASAGAIFVGQAIGAKAHDDVPRTVALTVKTACVWMGIVGLSYVAMPGLIMSAFAPDNVDGRLLIEVGVRVLVLSAAWQLFDATSMTLAEALRAAGDTAFTLWARAAIAWLIFAPGTWFSVRVLGGGEVVAAAWLVVYLALLALVLWLRFRTGKWRTMEITEGLPGH
jgi:multidrug resistance protein, MATE family